MRSLSFLKLVLAAFPLVFLLSATAQAENGGGPRGARTRPHPARLVEAKILSEIHGNAVVRPTLEAHLKTLSAGDRKAIENFLEGKMETISPDLLPKLSAAYRHVNGTEAGRAETTRALETLSPERVSWLERMSKGFGPTTVEELTRAHETEAAKMFQITELKLSDTVVRQLLEPSGAWSIYGRTGALAETNPTARGNALASLGQMAAEAHRLETHAGLSATDRQAGKALAKIVPLVAGDPALIKDVQAISDGVGDPKTRNHMVAVLGGLARVATVADYARSTSEPARHRLDIARALANGDAKLADVIAKKIEAGENKNIEGKGGIREWLGELTAEVRKMEMNGKTRQKLEKAIEEISKAKSVDEMLTRLNELMEQYRNSPEILAKLEEIRDHLAGRRMVLALEEMEAFRQLSPAAKCRLVGCAMRAAGLRTVAAYAGAAAALLLLPSMTNQIIGTNFRIPTGGLFAADTAPPPGLGKTVPTNHQDRPKTAPSN